MDSNSDKDGRRRFIKAGCAALAMIPIVAASGRAAAATNSAMRTSLKYQDHPMGDKRCATCMQFVPGKSPKDLGGCKLMPGDTEISPEGYCVAWTKKP
ncbi:MAG TPA: high-potential iron-sulfur protein [Rhodocyclaceae bacterium]